MTSTDNRTATRHDIMVTINEMDRIDYLYRRNALGRACKPSPTVHGILFQQPRVSVLVISPPQEGINQHRTFSTAP